MRRSRRNTNIAETIAEDIVETTAGLPPRSNRIAKRQKTRKKKLFVAGLYLFGAIAIGLIGFELFQASRNMPTVQYQAEKDTTIAQVNQSTPALKGNTTSPEPSNIPAKPQGINPTETSGSTTGTNPSEPAAKAVQAPVQQQAPIQKQPTNQKQSSSQQTVSKPTNNTTQIKAQPVVQQPAKPKLTRHRVVAGDTLFKLSRKYYGNGMGVDRIARQNHLNPEDPLPIGRVIYIPMR